MDICIFGGTGFVGSRVCARLGNAGHRLRVPTRNAAAHRELKVLPTLRLINADVHDPEAIRQLVAGCDVVINLIGILNEKGRSGAGFHRAHTEFARKLADASRAAGVRRLVQISALGASPVAAPSHYLRTKGQAEQTIIERAGEMEWVILQPSVIFGPNDSFLNRFAKLLRNLPLIFPLAMPQARFAPVHVEDVAAAVDAAAHAREAANQTFELCGPEIYSLRELVVRIARATGTRRWVIGLPDWLSRLQAAMMEFVPGKPFSLDNYRSLTRHSVCGEDGLSRLGIHAQSLELTINDCLAGAKARSPLDTYRKLAGRETYRA